MLLRLLPIAIAVIPILTINSCYVIAALNEHVAWCVPYLEGCTSISATGRKIPESFLFRAMSLPLSVLLGIYWVLTYHWLKTLGDPRRWAAYSILYLGIISSIFLIVYATVLGAIGDVYQTQRRIGATIYFSFTFLAQLILTSQLWNLKRRGIVATLGKVPETHLLMCGAMFTVGLISLPLSIWAPGADNIVEWNFALLMYSNFAVSYFGWKLTHFEIQFSTR